MLISSQLVASKGYSGNKNKEVMNCSLWNFCHQVRAVLKMDFNDSDIQSPLLSRSRGHTAPILFSLHLISVTVELVEKLKSNS